MRLTCQVPNSFSSFPHPGYSRSTKWIFVLVFVSLWVINEQLRTASNSTYNAASFAAQTTVVEAIKFALSAIYFYCSRGSQAPCLSPRTRRYTSVPDEEERALNDLNNSLEDEFVDVTPPNGYAQPLPQPIATSMPTAISVGLVVLAAFMSTYLKHTASLVERLTDPFTLYLGFPATVLFTFLSSFFILSRTFDTLQWQSALLQFCGLLLVQASLIPSPIAEHSYPFLMGFALSGSSSLLLMDFIYTNHHNISLELLHVIFFASSFLSSTVALSAQHPVQSTIQEHVSTFTPLDSLHVITQVVLDLLSLAAIFYFEAATAAVLVSFGAAVHLLLLSVVPATHTFALAIGSIVAAVASITYIAQWRRSDEKKAHSVLFNMVGSFLVLMAGAYVAIGSYRMYPIVSSYTSSPSTVTDIITAAKVTCPRKPLLSHSFYSHERQYHAFDNVLLIVFFSHARYDANLEYYKEVYSEFFPNIVFVGPGSREDAGFAHSYDVLVDSYQSDEDLSDPSFYKMAGRMAHHMLYTAMREYDCYDGYLWAPFDTLLNIPRLQQFDQRYFWYHSPFGQYVHNPALGDEVANRNASRHPPPAKISPDPAINLTATWRGWGPDWWWGEPHVGVEVCMRSFRKVPQEMRDRLAAKTNGTRLIGGSADTLYIPGKHRQTFMDILGLFLETDCFLEIATPTALHLAVPPEEPILYVDHWWIWLPPLNASFVRQQWTAGFEVDTFHTFHWGDKDSDGIWRPNPANIPDVRRLLLESATRQGVELPIRTIEREHH
ncbi:unnamed protein product [Somion occarium]|uniref:Uncharacterized protein n=1 Tax=Somion occarium TaxID=3059160 RepID=A0ABP1E235_9APHY